MHCAKSLYSEWGYVARTNSFSRTIQMVFVATAIGATTGAGVVLSLVDVPTGRASVAAHASAAAVQAAISAPAPALPNPPAMVKSEMPFQVSGRPETAASDLSANPKNPERADIAPLAAVDLNGAPLSAPTAPSAGAVPVKNKATKKHHVATRYPPRDRLFGFVQGERYVNADFGRPYRHGRWGSFYQNGTNRYHAWW
jgi:hypothetical protein